MLIEQREGQPEIGVSLRKKDLSIEGLRGMAALLVILNHLPFAATPVDPDMVHRFGFGPRGIFVAGRCGVIGVQLFFCISGYLFWRKTVLTPHRVDWSGFYVNRIFRLVPAYALSVLLICLCVGFLTHWHLHVTSGTLAHQMFTISSFGFDQTNQLNGMNTTYYNAIAWTLAYEWKFYVLLPLIVALRKDRRLFGLSCMVLLTFVFVYNPIWFLILFFGSGALAAELSWKPHIRPWLGTVVFLGLVAGLIAIPLEWVRVTTLSATASNMLSNAAPIVVEWIIVTAIFIAVVWMKPAFLTNRLMVFCGTVSYSLYVLHLIVLQVSMRAAGWIRPVELWGRHSFLLWAIAATILSLAVAALSYKLVEEPFLQRKVRERIGEPADRPADLGTVLSNSVAP